MSSPEDRLRAALRGDHPAPLDADAIMSVARRRRTLGRARIGAVAAALVVVAVGGWQIIGPSSTEFSEPTAGAAASASAAAPAPAATREAPGDSAQESDGDPARAAGDLLPGRSLLIHPERWCIVISSDAREVACAPRTTHVQRVQDEDRAEWLVMLAPSGPRTAVLQVEQPATWVSLRTSPVPEDPQLWVGVLPSAAVPEPPRGLRALDATGTQIWQP